MSNKLKFFIGFLVIMAGVSAFSFADMINMTKFRISVPALISNLESLDPIETDTDGDGLEDTEESYWNTDFQNPDTDGDGFLDGEEVASGHDPTKMGPDDKIVLDSTPQNVTDKLNGLVFAGLLEGSLQPESPDILRSVDLLVDEILHQTAINSRIGGQNVLFIISNSDENESKYAQQISPLLRVIAKETPKGIERSAKAMDILIATNDDTHPDFISFFETESDFLNTKVSQLGTLSVPEKWADMHNELMFLLRKTDAYYTLLREAKTDPFQAHVVMERLFTAMIITLPNIMGNYARIYIAQE